MKLYLAPGLALLALSLLGFGMWNLTQQKPAPVPAVSETGTHVITLISSGFSPTELTIQKGETVTFRNETNKPFWPASNLHPSHLIYPEFDPKQPVVPPNSWSHTFDKAGEWRFHDHLAPYNTGTITVVE